MPSLGTDPIPGPVGPTISTSLSSHDTLGETSSAPPRAGRCRMTNFAVTDGEPVSVPEWSLTSVIDVVSETVPEREMLVWNATRRTYQQVDDRLRRLAAFFRDHGLG